MFAMMARVSGPTFKTSLEQVARSVGIVQDYRHAEVRSGATHTTGPQRRPPLSPPPLTACSQLHSHVTFSHLITLMLCSLSLVR